MQIDFLWDNLHEMSVYFLGEKYILYVKILSADFFTQNTER